MIVGLKTVTDEFRVEEDALGDVQVPADHLWCAQVGAFARPALARGQTRFGCPPDMPSEGDAR
jgi:hypothetical protein